MYETVREKLWKAVFLCEDTIMFMELFFHGLCGCDVCISDKC